MELHPLRIILSSFEDRKKQDDQINIQIHLDQSKTYLLPSSVGKLSLTVLGEMTVCHALRIYGAEHL